MPRRPREVPRFGSVYGAPEPTRSAGSSASAATAGVSQSDPYTLVVPVVPDGDTILEVSGGRGYSKRYLIYSSVLCSTSSVFRVMLGKHSKFAEAVALRESRKRDDDEPIVVSLEGDDPAMMGFILQALHGKNKKVPRKITIGQLTRIAVICDKYGLHEALQVIAGTWSENLKAKVKTHPEEWLLISWVFGPEETFTEVSRDMILNGTAYQADGLVFNEERRALAECIPSAVTGELADRRAICVLQMSIYVNEIKRRYLPDDWEDNPTSPVCPHNMNATQCDAMQLGLLYKFLSPSGVLCIDGVSLREIAEKIQKLPVVRLEMCKPDTYCQCGTFVVSECVHNCSYAKSHKDCSWVPQLQEAVEIYLETVPGLKFSEFPSRTWD